MMIKFICEPYNFPIRNAVYLALKERRCLSTKVFLFFVPRSSYCQKFASTSSGFNITGVIVEETVLSTKNVEFIKFSIHAHRSSF